MAVTITARTGSVPPELKKIKGTISSLISRRSCPILKSGENQKRQSLHKPRNSDRKEAREGESISQTAVCLSMSTSTSTSTTTRNQKPVFSVGYLLLLVPARTLKPSLLSLLLIPSNSYNFFFLPSSRSGEESGGEQRHAQGMCCDACFAACRTSPFNDRGLERYLKKGHVTLAMLAIVSAKASTTAR